MQAGDEDFELKQMRDMAAAKKRWDALVLFKHHSLLFMLSQYNVTGFDKEKHESWIQFLYHCLKYLEKKSDFIASIFQMDLLNSSDVLYAFMFDKCDCFVMCRLGKEK